MMGVWPETCRAKINEYLHQVGNWLLFFYSLSVRKQTKGFTWYSTLISEIQNRALDTVFSFFRPAPRKENSNVRRGLEFRCASNWLTPWIKALLERLTVLQPVKQFSAFYGSRRFIAEFTRVRHLSVSSARFIQSVPSPILSLYDVLSSYLLLAV